MARIGCKYVIRNSDFIKTPALMSGCGIYIYEKLQTFKYCPFCGKTMNVVGWVEDGESLEIKGFVLGSELILRSYDKKTLGILTI